MKNETPFLGSDFSKIKSKYSHFLKEVRKRLVFVFLVFVTATLAGFVFYEKIIELAVKLLSLEGINIVFTSPFQFINLAISCGVAVGLVLVFPILLAQIISFLKPALKRKEFKAITGFLPFSLILFLIGFSFGAYLMKWQVGISVSRATMLGIGNMLDISSLLSTVLLTSAMMGLGFQFPIVLTLLIRLRIITRKEVGQKRLWIYLASFIFAMLLPANSIIVDLFLSLPLIILFEVTMVFSFFHERRTRR